MASFLILLVAASFLTWGVAHAIRQTAINFQYKLGLMACAFGIVTHIIYVTVALGGDMPVILIFAFAVGFLIGSFGVGDMFGRRTNWLRWLFGTGGHRYRQPLYPITRLPPDRPGEQRR